MQLSARNIVSGKVIDVKVGQIMATVKVDIGAGNVLTSVVTADSVNELNIKPGEDISVFIKATSVMLAR